MKSKMMNLLWNVDFRYLTADEEQTLRSYGESLARRARMVEELSAREPALVRRAAEQLRSEQPELATNHPGGDEGLVRDGARWLRACAVALLADDGSVVEDKVLRPAVSNLERLEIPLDGLQRFLDVLGATARGSLGAETWAELEPLWVRGAAFLAQRAPARAVA